MYQVYPFIMFKVILLYYFQKEFDATYNPSTYKTVKRIKQGVINRKMEMKLL